MSFLFSEMMLELSKILPPDFEYIYDRLSCLKGHGYRSGIALTIDHELDDESLELETWHVWTISFNRGERKVTAVWDEPGPRWRISFCKDHLYQDGIDRNNSPDNPFPQQLDQWLKTYWKAITEE